ncbi:MAG: hypothetical protein L0Z62_13745 [Gemmataceae bacterium]|nr:hypothetical protein [Gemmataceae bacterium]
MAQIESPDLFATLWQLVVTLGTLIVAVLDLALRWSLVIAWVAWWLWAVNWRRAWAVLAEGAWIPVLLLMLVAALVWSRLAPTPVGNFWWQLGAVGLLAAVALFCGWLQGVFGWYPPEIDLEPPAVHSDESHGHEHPVGTLHGHEAFHADEPQ